MILLRISWFKHLPLLFRCTLAVGCTIQLRTVALLYGQSKRYVSISDVFRVQNTRSSHRFILICNIKRLISFRQRRRLLSYSRPVKTIFTYSLVQIGKKKDKTVKYFLTHRFNYVFLVFKRTVSLRRFF